MPRIPASNIVPIAALLLVAAGALWSARGRDLSAQTTGGSGWCCAQAGSMCTAVANPDDCGTPGVSGFLWAEARVDCQQYCTPPVPPVGGGIPAASSAASSAAGSGQIMSSSPASSAGIIVAASSAASSQEPFYKCCSPAGELSVGQLSNTAFFSTYSRCYYGIANNECVYGGDYPACTRGTAAQITIPMDQYWSTQFPQDTLQCVPMTMPSSGSSASSSISRSSTGVATSVAAALGHTCPSGMGTPDVCTRSNSYGNGSTWYSASISKNSCEQSYCPLSKSKVSCCVPLWGCEVLTAATPSAPVPGQCEFADGTAFPLTAEGQTRCDQWFEESGGSC